MNSTSRLMKTYLGLATTLILLAGCGGGGSSSDDDDDRPTDTGQDARVAQMRFVNVIPDGPQIEMFHNGRNSSAFTEFLNYGDGSARKDFVIGNFQFNFNYTNGQGQRITLYEEADFPLRDGQEFSYIMIGELDNATLLRVDNDEFLVGLDDATADIEPQVQFVHAAVGVGPLDFYLTENGVDIATATPLATVSYGANSTLFDITASTTAQLRAFPAGNKADLLFDSGETPFSRTTRGMIIAANYFGPSNDPQNNTQGSVQLLRFGAIPVNLANANQPSSIRVHNVISDESAIDLYLDSATGAPLIANIAFKARSAEVVIPAQTSTLVVTSAGNPANVLLSATETALPGGTRRTLYVGGEASNPDDENNLNIGSSIATESNRAIVAGVPVRLFNGATQNTSLAVYLLRPGESIEGNTPSALMMGGYAAVSVVSGEFDLVIVESVNQTTIFGPERIIPEQGTTLNIVIHDTFGGTSPVVVDFTSESTARLQ